VGNEIRAAGGEGIAIAGDLSEVSHLPMITEKMIAAFGAIDFLVYSTDAGGSPLFVDTRLQHMQHADQLMVVATFELG
jgi:7-alpha-hydroxysteroid dehydrogenase